LARVVAAHHSFTKAHECCTACPLRHRSCLVLLFDAHCGYRIVDANMSVPACGRQCWRCCSLYSTSPVQPHWFVLTHNQPGCMAVRCAMYVASSCTALTAADGASRLPRLGITSVKVYSAPLWVARLCGAKYCNGMKRPLQGASCVCWLCIEQTGLAGVLLHTHV
jgi:hypothetical protein